MHRYQPIHTAKYRLRRSVDFWDFERRCCRLLEGAMCCCWLWSRRRRRRCKGQCEDHRRSGDAGRRNTRQNQYRRERHFRCRLWCDKYPRPIRKSASSFQTLVFWIGLRVQAAFAKLRFACLWTPDCGESDSYWLFAVGRKTSPVRICIVCEIFNWRTPDLKWCFLAQNWRSWSILCFEEHFQANTEQHLHISSHDEPCKIR